MTISITNCYNAIRGRGNPITGVATSDFLRDPDDGADIAVSAPSQEGWLNKTIQYRHACMMNIAVLNEQLIDKKFVSNRTMLERRKEFLMSEVNVCHRMLSMFNLEMN